MPLQPGLQPATVVTRRPAAFPGQFEELLTAQQRAKVAADISLRDRVKNAGDLNQQFAQSVHLKPELQGRIFNDTEKWHEVDRFLDAKAWEICRMLRVSFLLNQRVVLLYLPNEGPEKPRKRKDILSFVTIGKRDPTR